MYVMQACIEERRADSDLRPHKKSLCCITGRVRGRMVCLFLSEEETKSESRACMEFGWLHLMELLLLSLLFKVGIMYIVGFRIDMKGIDGLIDWMAGHC